jgi:hypothetical protein
MSEQDNERAAEEYREQERDRDHYEQQQLEQDLKSRVAELMREVNEADWISHGSSRGFVMKPDVSFDEKEWTLIFQALSAFSGIPWRKG